MKTFKFEITLTDEDLQGDEFWENAIEKDGTGITILTETIHNMIIDTNILIGSDKTAGDVVKLISYNEK